LVREASFVHHEPGTRRLISIQTAMLVGLGFLIASLLAVLLTPAYRARTVRLTSDRVRASLPATEQELKADKDRIRADNALRIHRLETQLEQFKFGAARQMVEVNRRDGLINSLNGNLESIQSELEVALNARNVLEQTIADRLPKVEQRLLEAKKLLFQRDREIANLTDDASRTQRALVEAVQINAQQRAEIERLTMVLDTRGAQNRDGLADPTFDAELALRTEIEALRTRNRDQTSLIERLQGGASEPASGTAAEGAAAEVPATVPEVVRLQRDLVRAETALRALKDVASAGQAEQSQAETALRQRDQKIEEQAQQIASLTAALGVYLEEPASDRPNSIKDSKIAMKSRLSALQAQSEAQAETIRKLRAEAAATNERLARQAQHFMEEMRRLGAGTLPASAQVRRPVSSAVRRTLTQRITEAKPMLAAVLNGASRPVLVKSDAVKAEVEKAEPVKGEAVKAEPVEPDTGKVELVKSEPDKAAADKPVQPTVVEVAESKSDSAAPAANDDAEAAKSAAPAADAAAEPAAARPAVAGRPRLLDRINDYGKG
jgi:hypothetical protein